MSSWLKSGLVSNLHSITGQITSFTKDLVGDLSLTSDENLADESSDADNLKSRIELLERECIRLNNENLNLKQTMISENKEKQEIITSSSCQTDDFASEFMLGWNLANKSDKSVGSENCYVLEEVATANRTEQNREVLDELAELRAEYQKLKETYEAEVKSSTDRKHEIEEQTAAMIASLHENYEDEIMKLQAKITSMEMVCQPEQPGSVQETKNVPLVVSYDENRRSKEILQNSLSSLNEKLDKVMANLLDHGSRLFMRNEVEEDSDDADFELCELTSTQKTANENEKKEDSTENSPVVEVMMGLQSPPVVHKYAQYLKSEAYIIQLERSIHHLIDKIVELMYGDDDEDDLLIPLDGENALELMNYAETLIINAFEINTQMVERLKISVSESNAQNEKLKEENANTLSQLNIKIQEYKERCALLEELANKSENNLIISKTETIESEPWECLVSTRASENASFALKSDEINDDFIKLMREKDIIIRNQNEELKELRMKNDEFKLISSELDRMKELNNVLERKLYDKQYSKSGVLGEERVANEVTDHELVLCNMNSFTIAEENLGLGESQEGHTTPNDQCSSSYAFLCGEMKNDIKQNNEDDKDLLMSGIYPTSSEVKPHIPIDNSSSFSGLYVLQNSIDVQTDMLFSCSDEQLNCDFEQLQAEKKALLLETEALKQHIVTSEAFRQKCENELAESRTEVNSLKSELLSALASLNKLIGTNDNNNMEETIMNVRDFINTKVTENTACLANIDALSETVCGYETKMTLLHEQVTELNVKLSQANEVKTTLETELSQCKQDMDAFRNKLSTLHMEKEELCKIKEKFESELQRFRTENDHLKAHLRNIEESNTLESLEVVENEERYKRRIQQLTDELHNIQIAHNNSEEELRKALGIALDESQRWQKELSVCKDYLAKVTEDYRQQCATSDQLKSNLDRFLADKNKEIHQLRLAHEKEIKNFADYVEKLTITSESLNSSNIDNEKLREINKEQAEKLTIMDKDLCLLRHELNVKDERIESLENTVKKLSPVTDSQIDKSLMREILLSYFRTNPKKRAEALIPMCTLLGFNEDELNEVSAAESGGGWLTGWSPSKKHLKSNTRFPYENQSFIQLFIQYIEQETLSSHDNASKESSRPGEFESTRNRLKDKGERED